MQKSSFSIVKVTFWDLFDSLTPIEESSSKLTNSIDFLPQFKQSKTFLLSFRPNFSTDVESVPEQGNSEARLYVAARREVSFCRSIKWIDCSSLFAMP